MDRSELSAKSVTELKQHAGAIGMKGYQKLRKAQLIDAIVAFNEGTPGEQSHDQPEPMPEQTATSSAEASNVSDSDTQGEDTTPEREPRNTRDGDRRSRRRSRRDEKHRDDNGRKENNRRDERAREDNRRDEQARDDVRRADRVEDETEEDKGPEVRAGVLDILPEGYGFLRTTGYLPGSRDVYVSQGQIRKYSLRRGDIVQGPIRPQRSNDKVPALDIVEMVNAYEVDDPADLPERTEFDQLPAIKAEDPLVLPGSQVTINRGQRMLIGVTKGALVTEMLADIATGLAEHNETAHLMVVAVDEAPEEITLLRRAVPGEVIASAFDRPADDHTQVADLALERAKRLVEDGWDVVVVLHSLTRLAKAWSLSAPGASRTVTGGLEPSAIHPVKRWLGAGRNVDGDGSLTVITTMDTQTGRQIDDVIADQFGYLANARINIEADDQGNLTISS
ncbi:Rho termination factor N-terminal domain-containing protein [Stomatohabitans albus]|uniref:Rho termination factor N-terminal domain-containing protein n=1 Tax=Stomatohabitans albus TaxID=3110766 RepID=UPI00300DA8EF